MASSNAFAAESLVGLYFEIYGLEEDDSVEFTLTAKKQNKSILDRLGGLLGRTSSETAHELTWGDPGESEPGVDRRFFNFDLGNLGEGEYLLTLEVRRSDGREAVASRLISIR